MLCYICCYIFMINGCVAPQTRGRYHVHTARWWGAGPPRSASRLCWGPGWSGALAAPTSWRLARRRGTRQWWQPAASSTPLHHNVSLLLGRAPVISEFFMQYVEAIPWNTRETVLWGITWPVDPSTRPAASPAKANTEERRLAMTAVRTFIPECTSRAKSPTFTHSALCSQTGVDMDTFEFEY